MNDSNRILLFTKAPLRGKVKTRLAETLGEQLALDLHRCFALDVLALVDGCGHDVIMYFYPPDAEYTVKRFFGEKRTYRAQEGNDLGVRMEKAFLSSFASNAEHVVLLGSDFPDLPPAYVTEALTELKHHDAVIGPARDGGYYLIGFRKETFRPEAFRAIRWSTDTVLRETMQALRQSGSDIHLLPQWQDVDTIEDLLALYVRNKGTAFERSNTMPVLRRICDTPGQE